MTEPDPKPDTPDVETPAAPGTEIVQFRSRNSLTAKVNYARTLAESGLLPSNYRKQPANVLYAVEYAEMLRLPPMAALTGVHVIDGKPSASAALISALVRREGHRLRVSFDETAMTATAEIVRADDPDFTFRSVWTLQRAVTAGLCELKNGKPWARSKKGEPTPWEKYPPAMLKARAVSEVARDACEEALCGVHYVPEELGADVDEDGVPTGTTVEQVDWTAEIRKCGNSRERLLALWNTAPTDEIKDRIKEAATAAGIPPKAKDAPKSEPTSVEDGPITVDAEIVEDEPATARGRLDKAIADNGWSRDKVEDLFIGQHGAELVEATNEKLLDAFREQLYGMSDGDLRAAA